MSANKPRKIFVDEEGKTIFLACEIRANIKLQWYHNDAQIVRNPPYVLDWEKESDKEKGSVLMIRPLQGKATDGKYDCVANTDGKIIKSTVFITLRKSMEKSIFTLRINKS
jgi:Immunoglobulin I-set domain.